MTTGPSEFRPDGPRPTVEEAIVATVAYADVFDMPIDLDRLHRFLLGARATRAAVRDTVAVLVEGGRLGRRGDLVYLAGRADVLGVHDDRVARADQMWPAARRWGKRIGRVPFVRMVAVTGGLAVDSVASHDDIDYFIVVAPGRLWLTRLAIVGLVRVAARLDRVELCPNYLVSERALDFVDHQTYVARELAQMVPVVGVDRCRDLLHRNRWLLDHLPNATLDVDGGRATEPGPSRLVAFVERVLLLGVFDRLEAWEMRAKTRKLRSVRSRRPEVAAPDESSFSPDVCKGHLVGNAAGIEAAWRARLRPEVENP